MSADQPTILATSGGYRRGLRVDLEFNLLMHHAVELALVTGRRPRVTYVGTAGGDSREWNQRFIEAARIAAFDAACLNLFTMPNIDPLQDHLLSQDVVWVGGGSVANLLAVWRVHGLDHLLHRAWRAGVVLGGVSAGSLCWFRGGATDSFGPELQPVTNGLGFLPYGNGVHYDSDEGRRPLIHRMVAAGTLGETHCTDDGVGLVYHDTTLIEAVTETPGKNAYIVRAGAGDSVDAIAVEEPLEARLLESAP